ncbi:hypothetical protein KPH14_012939 [Odynerus spinipes]|uniref:CCHC-type domain-containing protein n=1 Tax=Odynerus spinipes TaxID=1348599 RepID=A0AAD9R7W5_9HYME|nr:hypothetical protein KPH14_012939 [Odynerus spinipes]
MKDVSPSLNVRVKAVRKTKNGIAIETASEYEMKKVLECKKMDELGLKVELPKKIGPKVIVYDVPNEMANETLLDELYSKNVKEYECERVFKERVRVVSRASKKGANVGNVIIEVNKRMKERMCDEGRVYINWYAFKVREFVSVLRCYKCYMFGHMMRECGVKERLCQQCGEPGHMRNACKNACVCRNCKMKGMNCDHSVMSVECPEYKRMLEREQMRISDE